MVQQFVESITTMMREHESWAAPIAFLVAFGESLCFASIVWPGWAILVGFSGALAASGVSPNVLMPMVIAAGLGGAVGYAISYWIGSYFKDSIASIWPFKNDPALIPRGEQFFTRYGAWSVFLGHFVGPVRAVIPVIAGMFRMPQFPFQIANTASAFIWAAWAVLAPFWGIYYQDAIFSVILEHEHLAALGMFALAALHAVPIPILFWPTVVLLLGGSFLYLTAGGNALLLLAAGTAGVFAGDLAGYALGRTRKEDPHAVWPFSWYPDGIPAARAYLARWGAPGIITSKFLGPGRAYVPVVAGADGMPVTLFLAASLGSAVLIAAVCIAPRLIVELIAG
ncbi:MAG TPA: VTT domain-containing protein [Hyphomicrobium sp.]|nr:VTT domain-containing protein [Hyphomicrobium sp.]